MDSCSIATVEILQIPFACGGLEELVDAALDGHGLVTAPSAPCLGIAAKDPIYTRQLASSKLAIADSGAMVLVWRLARPNTQLRRVSGLAFLERVLQDERIQKSDALFLVDPSPEASQRNRQLLTSKGIALKSENQYVAPMYEPPYVEDPALLELIKKNAPRYILINLGGGIQERLGAWLQEKLDFNGNGIATPTIICTGAAIAFLTGEQTKIPRWADRMYLGWAIRCLSKPSLYIPRYFKSIPVLYYTLKDAIFGRSKAA